jgi:hypothetical protein
MFSVGPLYLPDITIAAENGVLQHPSIFHTDIKTFCNTIIVQKIGYLK